MGGLALARRLSLIACFSQLGPLQVPLALLLEAAAARRAGRRQAGELAASGRPGPRATAAPCAGEPARPGGRAGAGGERGAGPAGAAAASAELARLLAECGLAPPSGWFRVGPGGVPPPALVEAARLALLPPRALRRARRWLRRGPPLARPLCAGTHCPEPLREGGGAHAVRVGTAGAGAEGGQSGRPDPADRASEGDEGPAPEDVPGELQGFLAELCRVCMGRYDAHARPLRPRRGAEKRSRATAAAACSACDGGAQSGEPAPAWGPAAAAAGSGAAKRARCAAPADTPGASGTATGRCSAPRCADPRGAALRRASPRCGRPCACASDSAGAADGAWRAQAAAAVAASERRCWRALLRWLRARSSAQLVAGRCARAWRCQLPRRHAGCR
jgi:hypothetical protein